MNTVAWLFVFAGVLIIRFVSKGRGITDIPGDLGNLITGVLTNDTALIKSTLAAGKDVSTPLDFSGVSTGSDTGFQLGTSGEASAYKLGPVDPDLVPIANYIGTTFKPANITGWRDNPNLYGNADHKSGKSIDVFIKSKEQGDQIAAWLTQNPAKLNVKYVIWYQRIWYPGSGWSSMPDRGSDNNNHKNHVHLTVN